MIIYYPYIRWKLENGKKNNSAKTMQPIMKIKCERCEKIFYEKEKIFNKRIKLINKEYCGSCSRTLMSRIAGLKGAYNDDGSLKENKGRFTSEKWNNLSSEERKKRIKHNKEIAINFWKSLSEENKIKHFEKTYKNSKIGYISKAQREIYEILKNDNYVLDGRISLMKVDIINYKKKIAIEYHGDYWHCNPLFWKKDDFNKSLKMTAKEKWNNDNKRYWVLKKLGYDIHIIWEYDWINNREKIYKLLNTITDNNYKFKPYNVKKTLPLKGRTFEEIYGEEKALILKKNISKGRKNKKVKKKYIYKVITPKQGIFYVYRKMDWMKNVKYSNSKQIKYEKILYDKNIKLWNVEKFSLELEKFICPYCGLKSNTTSNSKRHIKICDKNINN